MFFSLLDCLQYILTFEPTQFQKILILSANSSWCTRGLQAATALTGLQIDIPKQPHSSSDLIKAFQGTGPPDARHPANGLATACMPHLDLLKFVIANDFESVLIIEDDVDWDLAIRDQMALISGAIRNFTDVPEDDQTPYGTSWDVLWIKHCGDWRLPELPRLEFLDPTRVPS
jgi:hypothetical protein